MPTDRITAESRVDEIFAEAIRAHERARRGLPQAIVAAAGKIRDCFAQGGRLLAFGNGGSAADAQHFVTELAARFECERPALAAVALTADSSLLTAVANDLGFEQVFARQIEAMGRPGDIAFAITTSGKSANVVTALEVARRRGLFAIALTGRDGGRAGAAADLHLNVAELSTARAQEVHITVLHALCALIESEL